MPIENKTIKGKEVENRKRRKLENQHQNFTTKSKTNTKKFTGIGGKRIEETDKIGTYRKKSPR